MNDDLPIFVASPIEIYHGDVAREKLSETNDNRFHTDADGVIKVDLQRWEQAQAYERKTWMEYNLEATEDRNTAHAQQFDNYAALPENLGDVLEIGCGPFTNSLKMVEAGHSLNSITLVDPLLNQYQAHPNKNYNRFTVPKTFISLAFEDAPADAQYDTVLLINVLPHCRDAKLVLAKAQAALKPGGYLVFAEFPATMKPTELYDVGHPIAPTAAFLADFLTGADTVYRNGWYFDEVYRRGWYFIGRKINALAGEWVETKAPKEVIEAIKAGEQVSLSKSLPPVEQSFQKYSIPEQYTVTGSTDELPRAIVPPDEKTAPKPRAKRTKKAK